jgi:hypothetical protein
MERVGFGVKLKERITEAALERKRAGKNLNYAYDPETGYKIRNEHTQMQNVSETENTNTVNDPGLISAQGSLPEEQYDGGRVTEFIAQKIGMGKDKFRQGEYVLNNATEEQQTAIDRGEASISGTFQSAN